MARGGPGEVPEVSSSAPLILYPRDLALAFPWNERLWPCDDLYASLIWRAAGADLAFAPDARARHDEVEHAEYPVDHEADRVYVNLVDAALVSRSVLRLLAFELLGFAAAVEKWARSPNGALAMVRAWVRGHAALLRDLPTLLRDRRSCSQQGR